MKKQNKAHVEQHLAAAAEEMLCQEHKHHKILL